MEKAGSKMVDLLARNDPWKGEDCLSNNCLLCMAKVFTNKDMQKDCTKCEKVAIEKAEEEALRSIRNYV